MYGYTHGNDFLLILTYLAVCMQHLEGVQILIRLQGKSIALDTTQLSDEIVYRHLSLFISPEPGCSSIVHPWQ